MALNYCEICGNKKHTPHAYMVQTGKVFDRQIDGGLSNKLITTQYHSVRRHDYDVCKDCFRRWVLIPIILYGLIVSILFINIDGAPFGLWLLFIFVAIVMGFFSREKLIKRRLKRKARKARPEKPYEIDAFRVLKLKGFDLDEWFD